MVALGDARVDADAVDATRVEGVETNLPFLRWLLRQPDVLAGTATTAFLDEHPPLSAHRRPRGPFAGAWRQRPAAGAGRLPVPRIPERQAGQRSDGRLIAPMPGMLLELAVAPGDRVEEGATVAILEAMKMEHRLVAPHAGVVAETHPGVGGFVDAGALIAVVERDG